MSGTQLSDYHKQRIREGLHISKRHKESQKKKNVNGDRNPNWKTKVKYCCPECGTILEVTEKKKKQMARKNATCSKSCGAKKLSSIKTGKPNPGASKYMKENNPMKNPATVIKMSRTLTKNHTLGKHNDLKMKLKRAGVNNLVEWNKSEKGRQEVSQRMVDKNPMHRKEVAESVGKTKRRMYAEGKLSPPRLSGSRFNRGYFRDKWGHFHHYDSGWEFKRMEFLDKQKDIIWKKNKKEIRIPYKVNGKRKTYFPDFIIKAGGFLIIEEIGCWMGDKDLKIKAAIRYCNKKGHIFYVLRKKGELYDKTW